MAQDASQPTTESRLGIFGGSFDPVHYGHLLLAECCREQCSLDVVRFIPAAISPHKVGSQPVSADDRVEMLQLAIGGHEHFEVSTSEIDRGGVSYTVDTLTAIKEEAPDRQLFFLMGADSLFDFPDWKSPERICELCTPVVVSRPGSPEPDFRVLSKIVDATRMAEIQQHAVQMPQIDISSTEIRERASTNRSIRFQLPRAAEKYIETKSLYAKD